MKEQKHETNMPTILLDNGKGDRKSSGILQTCSVCNNFLPKRCLLCNNSPL